MSPRRTISSPVGDLLLESDGVALTAIRFLAAASAQLPAGSTDDDEAPAPGGDAVLRAAAAQLAEYFTGTRLAFDLPVHATGTEFQESVWTGLGAIAYGRTWSYGELAAHVGRPTAVRAIGAACGRNPVPIVVPCHRVIGADGSLTGYAGGTGRKSTLLRHEARTLAGESTTTEA